MHRVFDRVVDNGRVLRTVFQMIRSGHSSERATSKKLPADELVVELCAASVPALVEHGFGLASC